MASNGSAPRETDATGGSLLRCAACPPIPTPVQPEPRPPLAARLVCGRPPRLPVAGDARPVCGARQRGHAPADPGVANRRAIPGVPGPLSDRRIARIRIDRRRARRVERPRVQPPRSRPPADGGDRRARRLAARRGRPVASCRGSARTPRARSPRSRSTRPSGWSTPTCGAGSSDASADRTSRRACRAWRMRWPRPGRGPTWPRGRTPAWSSAPRSAARATRAATPARSPEAARRAASRRAVPVARQPLLRGSDRAYRGAVLRLLSAADEHALDDGRLRSDLARDARRIGPALDEAGWARIVEALERDGLAHRAGGIVRLGAATIGP